MDNKIIEEMVRDIQNAVDGCAEYWAKLIAKSLCDKGYRKIDKDSVVLTREELEKIKTNNFSYGVEKGYKSGLLEASKETVEKFYKEIKNIKLELKSWGVPTKEDVGRICQAVFDKVMEEVDKLAKQFGVEIKE